MSKSIFKSLQIAVIAIWIILVGVLLYHQYISGEQITALQSVTGKEFKTSEQWFGIYQQGTKIGYAQRSTEKIGNEYRFINYSESDVRQDERSIHSTSKFTCLTNLEYRIKSFTLEIMSGGTSFKSHGELDENNVLLVFTETGEQKKALSEKIEGKAYLPATLKQILYERGLDKGRRFRIPLLNIFTLKVDDTKIEVQDLIPLKLGINVKTAYVVKVGDTLSWISDTGSTLKESFSYGLLYLEEAEDIAKSREHDRIFDYLSMPVQKSNKYLPEPEALSYVKLEISGLDMAKYPLLDEGRQRVKGGVLEIRKENVDILKEKTYALPYTMTDLAPYLSSTPFVQSDNDILVQNAKRLAEVDENAFQLARFLTSNVYLKIRKRPVLQLFSAMDVFKYQAGDSNEHTVMFTAFTRAAGLPTRMVGGFVYLRGYLYYHTWPEIWIDGWVPVDPTLGQFPADVTHIRLIEGDIDRLASLGALLKNIKITIVEAL